MCRCRYWSMSHRTDSRLIYHTISVKGRPHYYSSKKEEYAHIKFDLDAGQHLHHVYLFSNLTDWSIRFLLTFQLEHQASFCICPCDLAFQYRPVYNTSFSSHYMGHHRQLPQSISPSQPPSLATCARETFEITQQIQAIPVQRRSGRASTGHHSPKEFKT